MKLVQPYDAHAAKMAWVRDAPEALVRFVGAAEVLGAFVAYGRRAITPIRARGTPVPASSEA